MNKLFKHLSGIVLGLTMAVGVGAAISVSNKASEVKATDASITTFSADSGTTNGITYSGYKGGGTSNASVYSNCLRLYQPGTDGNLGGWAKFYLSNNEKITSFSVTFNAANAKVRYGLTSNRGITSASNSDFVSTNYSVSAENGIEITGIETDCVLIGNFRKSGSNNTQRADIKTITLTYSGSKVVTTFTLLDEESNDIENNSSINITASGSSASYTITGDVAYSQGPSDADYKVVTTSESGISIGEVQNDGDCSFIFSSNGTYEITATPANDSSKAITFSFVITGIVDISYVKVTNISELKSGSEFIICNSDGTKVMAAYVSGNNCAELTSTPKQDGSISQGTLPAGTALLTLSGTTDNWVLTDQNDKIYYGTSSANRLQASTDASGTFAISINNGLATITSNAEANRNIRYNNTNGLFACYTSGQKDVCIYAIPRTDPAILLDITSGSESLDVDGTATLKATLINGATGNVAFNVTSNVPSAGSGNVVSLGTPSDNSVVVTGLHDGLATVTASLAGCENVSKTFTVTKKLASLAITTAPTTTVYSEGEEFSTAGTVLQATYDDGSVLSNIDPVDDGVDFSPKGNLTTSITQITFSYTEGDITVYQTQAITVNARVVQSIYVDTMPTKLVYAKGDTLDTTGLVIKAVYNVGDDADVTSSCTYSPTTLTTIGESIAIDVSFGSGENEKHTSFNVKVNDIAGPIENGRYFMSDDEGNTLKAGNISTNTGADVIDIEDSIAWTFTLVANNTYTIEYDGNYLYSQNNNDGIRTKDSATNWVISYNGDGTYALNTYDGTQTRYLAVYGTQDFRAYKNTGQTADYAIYLIEETVVFADNFVDSFTGTCVSSGSHGDIAWTKASDQYSTLSSSNKLLFKNATYLISGSGESTEVTATGDTKQYIAEAAARYDYIVGKYGTSSFTDFMQRNPSVIGSNISFENLISNNNLSTITIVIISLASLTAIGGYFYIRRRKEN